MRDFGSLPQGDPQDDRVIRVSGDNVEVWDQADREDEVDDEYRGVQQRPTGALDPRQAEAAVAQSLTPEGHHRGGGAPR